MEKSLPRVSPPSGNSGHGDFTSSHNIFHFPTGFLFPPFVFSIFLGFFRLRPSHGNSFGNAAFPTSRWGWRSLGSTRGEPGWFRELEFIWDAQEDPVSLFPPDRDLWGATKSSLFFFSSISSSKQTHFKQKGVEFQASGIRDQKK